MGDFMDQISTVSEMIALWPRQIDLAADISLNLGDIQVTSGQVHKWAKNNSIPAKYHHGIIAAAKERGFAIDAALIVALHRPQVRAA